MELEKVHDHIFENEKIILDGKHWQSCTFRNCKFVMGTAFFSMNLCTIQECELSVLPNSPAYNVISMIEMIYPGALPFESQKPNPGQYK